LFFVFEFHFFDFWPVEGFFWGWTLLIVPEWAKPPFCGLSAPKNYFYLTIFKGCGTLLLGGKVYKNQNNVRKKDENS